MNMRLRRRTWVALAALLASGAALGVVARGPRSMKNARAGLPGAPEARPDPGSRDRAAGTLETVRAARAALSRDIQVVGSVSPAGDHFAVVGPPVSGRVMRLHAGIGDQVRKGQVLGEVDSAEAGQATGEYVAAKAALAAAEANAVRERELAERQISSNRAREVAEAQAVSQKAKMRAALAHLHAIGFDAREVRGLEHEGTGGVLIPLRAPISGTIIKRTVTMGQSVERATDAFTIADLSRLWVQLDIYEKDLGRVHAGQRVNLRTDAAPGEVFEARVAYVGPVVDEKTHTGHVRVEFENTQGTFRLNQRVTARIIGDPARPGDPVLAVPRGALQHLNGTSIVFVRRLDGFERRVVQPGISGGDLVEVRSGLREGEEVARAGASVLDRELLR
jgi:membrane fusion protein, heavy metal efflux system